MTSNRASYITADLHLRGDPDEPALPGFRALCRRVVEEGVPLYVLGDLFDFWVGARQARLDGFRNAPEKRRDLLFERAVDSQVKII